MTTTDTTYASLCSAIDDGDDTALPALADWLEERGDPRAEGMRLITGLSAMPTERDRILPDGRPEYRIVGHESVADDGYVWWERYDPIEDPRGSLDYKTFGRLRWVEGAKRIGSTPSTFSRKHRSRWLYPTRHAAILALAAALTQGD